MAERYLLIIEEYNPFSGDKDKYYQECSSKQEMRQIISNHLKRNRSDIEIIKIKESIRIVNMQQFNNHFKPWG